MSFVIQFLLPLSGVLTAGLLLLIIVHLKSIAKHDHQSVRRHEVVIGSQEIIAREVEKVGKKIDREVIPMLANNYVRKDNFMFEASAKGIAEALELVGLVCSSVGEDGDLFLVAVEDGEEGVQGFRVYYFLHLDLEAKDLLIECYAYEMSSYAEGDLKSLMVLNDRYKISGFSIEEVSGYTFLKAQHLLFLSGGHLDGKRLDISMTCLLDIMKEAVGQLTLQGVEFSFVGPREFMKIQATSRIPNEQS